MSTSFRIMDILGKRANHADGPVKKKLKFSVSSMLNNNFSMDSILQNMQPVNSSANFSIDNLLNDQDGGRGSPYTLINRAVDRNPDFNMCDKTLLFQFNFKKMKNPIEDMVHILDTFILKELLTTCFKVSIKIKNIKSGFSINLPYEPPKKSYYQSIIDKFMSLEQSESFSNFTDGRIQLYISQILKRSGQGRIAKLLNQDNINQNALMDVKMDNNYCLFNSFIAAKSYATLKAEDRWRLFRKLEADTSAKVDYWKKAAEDLMTAVGAPFDGQSYSMEEYGTLIIDHFNSLGEGTFRVGVFDACSAVKPFFKYGPSEANHDLHILFFQNHFTAIKNISHLTKSPKENFKYCLDCEKSFSKVFQHTHCVRKCNNCCRWGSPNYPCQPDGNPNSTCSICSKSFWNRECFDYHLKKNICKRYKKCPQCDVTYRVSVKHPHDCSLKFCRQCRDFHEKRPCYITKIDSKDVETHRILTFDFECSQDTPTEDNSGTLHEVNCVVAKITCTNCADIPSDGPSTSFCDVCGPNKVKKWNAAKEDNILQKFMHWMLFELNPKYKTVALSHYGGRYDMVLLLKELYDRPGLKTSVIRNGNKFFQVDVTGGKKVCHTVFKDTYNFFPVSLDSLVSAFDLDVLCKPFFPHAYNKRSNFHINLPNLPPKSDYFFESMMPQKKEQFLKFYEENYHTPFLLSEELEIYCEADVNILYEAVLSFRKSFLTITGLDAFNAATTIAGLCQKYFRNSHMKDKEHVIIPENGFEVMEKCSREAILYFMWLNEHFNKQIRFSESPEGEKRILNYKVDGIEDKTVYEYDGCCWHGCSICYQPDTLIRSGVTNAKAMAKTAARKAEIRGQGYEIITIKSCEVLEMRKQNKEMDEFFKKTLTAGPIAFRDAFMGGRTHPMALHAVCDEFSEIVYKDIVSLYPSINYNTSYPCGFPTIHKFSNHNVNWTSPDDNPYKGIIKCFVIPPQNLTLAVIPHRVKDRLLFPLCAQCGSDFKGKNTRTENYECKHTPEQRGFVTTLTHLELNLGLEHNYVVKKLFRVYEYTQWSDSVFKSYVVKFLKLKVETSGWPSEVQSDLEKQNYVTSYKVLFNIDLDPDNIRVNANMRGRFALRNNLSSTIVTQSPSEMYKIVGDPTKVVSDIDWVSKHSVMITYKDHEDFITTHEASCVLLSLWTTSAARCVLFSYLHKINATEGCKLLYCDTDSVIFVCPRGRDPLPDGIYLGEMSNEKPHHEILEFLSSGAKQYALKLKDKRTGDISYNLKIRGITLNSEVSLAIHYDSFRESVMNYREDHKITVKYNSILPNKTGFIKSKQTTKTFRPYFDKGIISLPSMTIFPFGYKES